MTSAHFLQRAMCRRTRPPQREQIMNFDWSFFFVRGRSGIDPTPVNDSAGVAGIWMSS